MNKAEVMHTGADIVSTTRIVELSSERMCVRDTDKGTRAPGPDQRATRAPLRLPPRPHQGAHQVTDPPCNRTTDTLSSATSTPIPLILEAIKSDAGISRAWLAAIVGCSASTIKRRPKEMNIAWLGHPRNGHWVFVREIE